MSGWEREREAGLSKQTQLAREEASGHFILGETEITKTPSFLNNIF